MKEIAGLYYNRPPSFTENEHDATVTETEALFKILRIYIIKLLNDNTPENPLTKISIRSGLIILKSEIIQAINSMTNNKAPGSINKYSKTLLN